MTIPAQKPRVQSVFRAGHILLACAQSPDGLMAKDLADSVGLSRQATYHLLHTLRAVGFIEKRPDQRFRLGLAVGILAEALERQLAPPARLLPHLQSLARTTGEACSVVGWHDGEPVVLAHAPGYHAVRVSDIRIGQSGNAHARASGKLLLARATSKERESYLNAHELVRLTARTIVSRSQLECDLAHILGDGYAVDREEYADGVYCVAVPVKVGVADFALSISAPSTRFELNFDRYLGEAFAEAARVA